MMLIVGVIKKVKSGAKRKRKGKVGVMKTARQVSNIPISVMRVFGLVTITTSWVTDITIIMIEEAFGNGRSGKKNQQMCMVKVI